ncbi:MAG TPA: lipid A biosynthesis acyltransferase [Campylobacterales bacterium]|nr:lipid A biosynthesis acyltransferase [Campylobacterales bacterium]
MATKQRGSGWSIKLVFNLYKVFGYKFIYYLMYPVSLFYALISTNVRVALKDYYAHLGIKMSFYTYFEHSRMFAITMVDRFITKADPASYKFVYDDPDRPLEIFSSATILLFSHFGGWAASSNSSRSSNVMNIVMQEAMKDTIKELEEELGYKSTQKVIDLNKGPIAVSISIANALSANEVVAIMGDRASNPKATIAVEFLGKEALFNKNPFQIAYKTKTPLVAYFVMLTGLQEYKIEFIEIDVDYEKKAKEAIEEAVLSYIKKYEEVIKRYPSQWLNLYDFWKIP